MTSLSKHFMPTDVSATGGNHLVRLPSLPWAQGLWLRFLGHKDYGGLLETCRHYRLGQGEVENVSEDT